MYFYRCEIRTHYSITLTLLQSATMNQDDVSAKLLLFLLLPQTGIEPIH